jgi:acetyltransferase-like isoleucine patch superfamily enzyme
MAGAVIGAEAKIGDECIVNTKASVDHEDVLEDAVEIAPGATLCGAVHVGTAAWVCAGATVLPRIRIGADAIVGAGAVVIRDVAAKTKVVGVPARIMAPKNERPL